MKNKSFLAHSVAAQKLLELAIANNYLYLGLAIMLAIHAYSGIKRKNDQDEVDHSIAIAWALWSRGVTREEDLVKAILHDLVEAGKVTIEFIRERFNDEIADDVDRLSKRPEEKIRQIDDAVLDEVFDFIFKYYYEMKTNWSCRVCLTKNRQKVLKMLPRTYKKAIGAYYQRLAKSPICVVIKNYDKCDIFRNMSYSIPVRNQKLQVVEYEAFLALECKKIRKTEKKYLEILFGGRNEIESLIENVLYHIFLKNKLVEKKNLIVELKSILDNK